MSSSSKRRENRDARFQRYAKELKLLLKGITATEHIAAHVSDCRERLNRLTPLIEDQLWLSEEDRHFACKYLAETFENEAREVAIIPFSKPLDTFGTVRN